MRKVTAIFNLKGGVGKTTTVINMAAILADEYDANVLVIDADAQCNTTEFFGGETTGPRTLAGLLRSGLSVDQSSRVDLIRSTNYSGIELIPAEDSLMDLDLSKVEAGTVHVNVLRALVKTVGNSYDYILIDCPPSFSAASAASLVAADDVIIPIKIDAFSIRGMGNLLRQIQNMQQINPRLRLSGVLPTMWYNHPKIQEMELAIRKSLPVYPHIRRSDTVDRMTFQQAPLRVSSPNSGAGQDYRAFVQAYVQGVTK